LHLSATTTMAMMCFRFLLLCLAFLVCQTIAATSSADTIQPLLFTNCENSTAEIVAENLDAYGDSLFAAMNPASGYVVPGDQVTPGNITQYRVRERSLQEVEGEMQHAYLDDEGDRRLFGVCPKECANQPGIPVCRALKCRTVTTTGRRLQTDADDKYFSLNVLSEKLNMRASELTLTYGCQISLFIVEIDED